MNSLDSLREIYSYDPQTRTFTIPVRLGYFSDFFNPLDPSPAPARDLSPDLVGYLNQCSDEIGGRYLLAISMQIRHDMRDQHNEQECLDSLRSFYQHEMFITRSVIQRKHMLALRYLLFSMLCLSAFAFSQSFDISSFVWGLLQEAVLIGGWVFMWEAVTVNIIEMDAHQQELKRFKRLIRARVDFRYG